ncbi:DUF2586 domain-containing protein (plasmid) [Halodesulfovibrio aestuarii]|uniref:DUF2586 family protein n=1 Tax=Halodesulfovibrio aestuarii TaxID=126333 RepID=A0A8G2CC71_9BACT|nr:DUF2586 domain-containing protein [Halodesulfovibrio aestuarii]SHJ72053.1 Protein of unknown function [Halodesulfovibrio aestuarii]
MATGQIQINRLNRMQGPFNEVERYFCYIGQGSTNQGKLVPLNTDTDLDEVLGSAESILKTQIEAAKLNAGQNWNACAFVLDENITWDKAVDTVMEQAKVEAIAVTDPITASTDLEAMRDKQASVRAQYQRPLVFIATIAKINPETESWSDFITRATALVTGIKADCVSVAPYIWGHEVGTYAGRLCDRSVTVADSPMRVETGELKGQWSNKPTDKDGREIDTSILKALANARLSVPWWYADYEGLYWTDGHLLDVEGGDYQVIENLRVVQKAMRRVYKLAVARIADRKLNSTPDSINYHSGYFMRPLREMSKSVEILGQVFPGEVKPPKDGDIVISWPTRTTVGIYMAARPYNCPKAITCNLMLDLSNPAAS